MAIPAFVVIQPTYVGNEEGFDLEASDDFTTADAVFMAGRKLDEAIGCGDRKRGRNQQDAVAVVAWYMRNSGEAADILQAALDNDEVIDTSWGPVGPKALRQRLMVLDAKLMAQQLDEQTQAARGKPRGSRI